MVICLGGFVFVAGVFVCLCCRCCCCCCRWCCLLRHAQDGTLPLHAAVVEQEEPFIEALLAAHANVNSALAVMRVVGF